MNSIDHQSHISIDLSPNEIWKDSEHIISSLSMEHYDKRIIKRHMVSCEITYRTIGWHLYNIFYYDEINST